MCIVPRIMGSFGLVFCINEILDRKYPIQSVGTSNPPQLVQFVKFSIVAVICISREWKEKTVAFIVFSNFIFG